MSERVRIHYAIDELSNRVSCVVEVHDRTLLGHAAELRVRRRVRVHDERPVDSSDVVLRRTLPSLAETNEIEIHRASLQAYSYRGTRIDVEIHSELEIDDGVLFDTAITEQEELLLAGKPEISSDARGIVQPSDAFNFATNFNAIPPANRFITALLLLGGLVAIALNSWVGFHDQFSPAGLTWVYDHIDSDGDSESPLVKSLMASGALGAAVWFAIRRQLRKYMTFEICNLPARVRRSAVLRAAAVLRGRSRVELRDVRLRVVACNMEKGQYKRGHGTKERTVSFSEAVRAVVLYDQHISAIPGGVPVERYFDGEIDFEPMFSALYPPQRVGSSHGLDIYWEVQLIHDELVDQELVGPVDCFAWNDFLEA